MQCGARSDRMVFDHLYGEGGTDPDLLYEQCVAPLVGSLFKASARPQPRASLARGAVGRGVRMELWAGV